MKSVLFSALLFFGSATPVLAFSDTSLEANSVLSAGTLVAVGGHKTQGSVQIEKRADGLYLVLNSDFSSQNGPDLRLILRDHTNVTPMFVVASLKRQQGQQEYKLALTTPQLAQFSQVSVYCLKFHVDFAVAQLK